MSKKTDTSLCQEAQRLYTEENKNACEVGEILNLSDTTIRNILKRQGVKLKTLSEARQKHLVDNNYFKNIDTEEKAYWLGLLYADGYVSKNGRRFELSLSGEEELKILNRFKECISYTGDIKPKKIKGFKNPKPCHRIGLSSPNFVGNLINKGCYNKKSLTLKFPTLEQVPHYLMNHFIRGFVDGDGAVSFKKNKTLLIGIISSVFFSQSLELFLKDELGINIGLYKKNKSVDIKLWGLHAIKFLDWVYRDATIYFKRKKDKFDEYMKYMLERFNNKTTFACLKQDEVKEWCSYFNIKYTDDFLFSSNRQERDKIVDLFKNNTSISAISRQMECSETLIYRVLKYEKLK